MRKVMSSSWKKSRDVEAQAFQRLKDSLGDQFLFSQLIEDRLCPDFLIARKDEMSAADATHMLGVHDAETLSQFRSSEFSSKTLSIEMKSASLERFTTDAEDVPFSQAFSHCSCLVFVCLASNRTCAVPWNYLEVAEFGDVKVEDLALVLATHSVTSDRLFSMMGEVGNVRETWGKLEGNANFQIPTLRRRSSRRRAPPPPPAPPPAPPPKRLSEEEIRKKNWEERKQQISADFAAKAAAKQPKQPRLE